MAPFNEMSVNVCVIGRGDFFFLNTNQGISLQTLVEQRECGPWVRDRTYTFVFSQLQIYSSLGGGWSLIPSGSAVLPCQGKNFRG